MVQSAIDDCHANCDLNGLSYEKDGICEYHCGKAEDILPEISKEINGCKVVAIVDPPRSGLHPVVLKTLRTTVGLEKIVYVS